MRESARYERVTYQAETRKRTVYLRDPREITFLGAPALTGIEVNREAAEVASKGADERQHVIGLDLVSKRTPVAISRKYGTLEEES